ncbi:MAG TPA: B12-binding domain-containing protein [Nocardioides sp.]|nr:B12-binding domain-containing protein [Nocardioides sp.]
MLHAALGSARQTGQVELLTDALRFAHGRFAVRGLSRATYVETCAALEDAAAATLAADDRDHLRALFARCLSDPTDASPDAEVLGPLSAAYVDRLAHGDRAGAIDLVRRCVTDGMEIDDILLDVLEPAQREVGRRWALGLISVAHEHFCTAVTQFVMTELYAELFSGHDSRRRLVAVHAPGSLHQLGLRMVVDVLESRNWSTTYVVDDVMVDALPGILAEDQADLLLISATMPSQIVEVSAMIRAVRQDPRTRDVKIVVGGRPFNLAPGLAGVVGADRWASDARSAVEVCDELVGADDHR